MPGTPVPTTPLADIFEPGGEADWQAAVVAALKGGSADRLTSHTADGIAIAPLYQRAADAPPRPGREPGAPWAIVQRVDHPEPDQAHALAREDLAGGANGLALTFQGARSARGFGLPLEAEAIKTALSGLPLAGVQIRLEAGDDGAAAGEAIATALAGLGLSPGDAEIRFAHDPIGGAAMRGILEPASRQALGEVAAAMAKRHEEGFRGPFLEADGRPWHEAGASEAQELALVLATGLAYLRAFEDAGCLDAVGAKPVGLTLAVDADQFLTTAKIRAARRLWRRLVEASALAELAAPLHAETAWRMLTRVDPWVNILRGTIAAVAAGIAGADSVTVLPFTQAEGLPDGFARRIARNTQSILIEESNLHRVADPAAGSGGLEALSDALAEKAWSLFQEIERAGGVTAALEAGLPQGWVAETARMRAERIARRTDRLTGASAFANLAELPVEVLAVEPRPEPGHDQATLPPLPSSRLAEPFEALRARAAALADGSGGRPTVLVVELDDKAAGDVAAWARGVFELGGLSPVSADATNGAAPALACICASEAGYETLAAERARALRAAGAAGVVLACRKEPEGGALQQAGVDTVLVMGGDVVAALGPCLDVLEAST